MAQIATLLSDRARREGSAYVGRTDLDLVEPLELGQVVIIEDTATGDRILGWIADELGAAAETVYRFALGPVLAAGCASEIADRARKRYGLQDVENLLDDTRACDFRVPRPRKPEDALAPEDS